MWVRFTPTGSMPERSFEVRPLDSLCGQVTVSLEVDSDATSSAQVEVNSPCHC